MHAHPRSSLTFALAAAGDSATAADAPSPTRSRASSHTASPSSEFGAEPADGCCAMVCQHDAVVAAAAPRAQHAPSSRPSLGVACAVPTGAFVSLSASLPPACMQGAVVQVPPAACASLFGAGCSRALEPVPMVSASTHACAQHACIPPCLAASSGFVGRRAPVLATPVTSSCASSPAVADGVHPPRRRRRSRPSVVPLVVEDIGGGGVRPSSPVLHEGVAAAEAQVPACERGGVQKGMHLHVHLPPLLRACPLPGERNL